MLCRHTFEQHLHACAPQVLPYSWIVMLLNLLLAMLYSTVSLAMMVPQSPDREQLEGALDRILLDYIVHEALTLVDLSYDIFRNLAVQRSVRTMCPLVPWIALRYCQLLNVFDH